MHREYSHPFASEQALADRYRGIQLKVNQNFSLGMDLVLGRAQLPEADELLRDVQEYLRNAGAMPEDDFPEAGQFPEAMREILRQKRTSWMHLQSLMPHVFRRAVLTAEFEPSLTFAEWRNTPPPAARLIVEGGVPEAEVLPQITSGRFDLECFAGCFPIDGDGVSSAADLARAITDVVFRGVQTPEAANVASRFWNRACRFNPDRILNLRLERLSWNPLEATQACRIGCGGVEEARQLPEERLHSGHPPPLPAHPTLPVPWRVVRVSGDTVREVSLHHTREEAEQRAAQEQAETDARMEEMAKSERPPDVKEEVFRPWLAYMISQHEAKFNVAADAPDLPVINGSDAASRATALGLKAREIWFQRYREVVEPALPPAHQGLVFLLDSRPPRHPLRTYVAQLHADAPVERPSCPDCGALLDVAVHLNVRHHRFPFPLPAPSLLLFTCSEHGGMAEMWEGGWLSGEDALERSAGILRHTRECLSGPPVRVTEYDKELVDTEALAPTALNRKRFDDGERAYAMYALQATKVGGVPAWIQGPEVPDNKSGKPMQFIAQVAATSFMELGDAGILYLFYCPETQEMGKVVQYY